MTGPLETRHRMALATMIALFASLGRTLDLSDASAIILLPDLRLMPIRTAIARIAELSPAVTCVAFEADGMVSVCVWSGMQADDFADDVLELVQEEIQESWPGVLLDAVDVVVGTDPSTKARLSWPEFSQWRREYRIPLCEMIVSGRHDAADDHTLSAAFTPSRAGGTLAAGDHTN
jgi:hypothetical protein